MTAIVDLRARRLDAFLYPGNPAEIPLVWPAGYLIGRTFTSTLDGQPVTVEIAGDTMTIVVSAAATLAADAAPSVRWELVDTTAADDVVRLAGRWAATDNPADALGQSFTIVLDDTTVEVDVSGAALLAAHEHREHRSFVHVTDDWLDRWTALLALTDTRLVRLATMVDSVGIGQWATDWLTDSYIRVAGDALQDLHGDGGSGWIDGSYLANGFVPGGGQVTETGLWTFVAGGVNGYGRRPTTPGNGATVTMPFRGTALDIVQRRGSGFGSWTYQVDGGAPVVVSAANATADIHTTTVVTSAGTHTVTITASTGDCRIYGVRGTNALGLLVDNYGQGGRSFVNAAGGGAPITVATEGIGSGVDSTLLGATLRAGSPMDVFLLAMSVNDSNAAAAPIEAILDVLGQVWDVARQMGPTAAAPPLPIMVIEHVGRHDADSTPEYTKHSLIYRGWAESIGAAVVDYWTFGRNTWDYWASLSFWGIGNTDNVHPNTAGHAAMAAPLIDLLTT